MKVFVNNEEFKDNIKYYISVFLKDEEIIFVADDKGPVDLSIEISDVRITALYYENFEIKFEVSIGKEHPEMEGLPTEIKKKYMVQKRIVRGALYDILSKITDTYVPWGILTGMRPTKVVYQLVEKYGKDKDKIASILYHRYKISKEKVDLLIDVVGVSGEVLERNEPGDCSLYVGIPFCPSTCAYCSFTSYPIGKYSDRVSDYLEALAKEAKAVSEKILPKRKLRSIYVGGGTPTSLNELQLERLMKIISQSFDKSHLVEFTVEAGRPDTITKTKLEILKSYGVTRISINPQTMTPETLKIIGRNHSIEEINKAVAIAKEVGFEAINMDLIIGLPNESAVDTALTLEKVLAFQPDNVTVHTLALKHGSKLTQNYEQYNWPLSIEVKNMLSLAYRKLRESGYMPYYLYRQKNMASHLENVGFCKVSKESYYNIQIIDEWQDIIAIGAGVVSKKVDQHMKMQDRLENVKDVYQYIDRIDEISKKKVEFYR
jgi:oxygen-independent coproporphyrinogen-3 oxidase